MGVQSHSEYPRLATQRDPGASKFDVRVEEGLVGIGREKGGVGFGEGYRETLVAGPDLDAVGVPRQTVRSVCHAV